MNERRLNRRRTHPIMSVYPTTLLLTQLPIVHQDLHQRTEAILAVAHSRLKPTPNRQGQKFVWVAHSAWESSTLDQGFPNAGQAGSMIEPIDRDLPAYL